MKYLKWSFTYLVWPQGKRKGPGSPSIALYRHLAALRARAVTICGFEHFFQVQVISNFSHECFEPDAGHSLRRQVCEEPVDARPSKEKK